MSTSAPQAGQDERIAIAPFIVYALLLPAPLLSFDFRLTFYRMGVKLFVFELAVTALWGYVLWEWAHGRVRAGQWPAWWLFAPLVAWVAWGAATAAWSGHPRMAGQTAVEGFYGLAAAAGLAVLLRERGQRRVFLAAGSAVAFVAAVLMIVFFGKARSGFFGDLDVSGREVGAAFVLVPTLVAAALLYGRPGEREDIERRYAAILWTTAVLAALLLAAVRAGMLASAYALGVGVVVTAWLLLPRFRPLWVVLGLVVAALFAANELRVRQRASLRPWRPRNRVEAETAPNRVREALLDRTEWAFTLGRPLHRLLLGDGAGTLVLALDARRPPETYTVEFGDMTEAHARRALTEVLYERGLVGVGLALAVGLVAVAAGVLALRRARDGGDAALGAGLAGAVVAFGVYSCLGSGPVNFGASMALWIAMGLLGALSVRTARPSALSWSESETLARRERPTGFDTLRGPLAVGVGLAVLVAWVVLSWRPLRASLALRDGRGELEEAQSLGAQRAEAERILVGLRQAAKEHADKLKGSKPLADEFRLEVGSAEQRLEAVTEDYVAALRGARSSLERACRLTLDGRIWLNAQISLVYAELAAVQPEAAAERYEGLAARYGSSLGLGLLGATVYEMLDRPEEANRLFVDYARRNPLAASCALFRTQSNLYPRWLALVERERAKEKPDPRWRQWAWDFNDACARGLAIYPDHYGLLMYGGEILYRLGRDDESYDMQMAARDIARRHVFYSQRRRYGPRLTADLLLDLANTCLHWDKPLALSAISRLGPGELGLDPRMYPDIFHRAFEMRRFLDPGWVRDAEARIREAREAARRQMPDSGPLPSTSTPPTPSTAHGPPPALSPAPTRP